MGWTALDCYILYQGAWFWSWLLCFPFWFLLIHIQGGNIWWFKYLGSCLSYGRLRRLLVLVCISLAGCEYLECEVVDRSLSVCLSLSPILVYLGWGLWHSSYKSPTVTLESYVGTGSCPSYSTYNWNPINNLGKVVEDGLSVGALPPMQETWRELLALALAMSSGEWTATYNVRLSLSCLPHTFPVFLSVPISLSLHGSFNSMNTFFKTNI